MLSSFYPHEYCESVFSIDYESLYRKGFRGIIFDVDNTLVPHGANSTEKVDALFRTVQGIGFKTVLLSDNDADRLERFLEHIECPYVCDAEKPSPEGYAHALDVLKLPKNKVVFIGDQIFTDIRGANASGIPSILVKYIGYYDAGKKGKRRFVEKQILRVYSLSRKNQHRLGGVEEKDSGHSMPRKNSKHFSDINPLFYKISERKEIIRRQAKDILGHEAFAQEQRSDKLPNVVSSHSCKLIKRGPGIDLTLQENKAVNIEIASATMNGLVVHPGESFSFWHRVGNTTKRRGYLDGRVIVDGKLEPGIGGGLCNLGNTVHWLVLHSPLTITELHTHSDALAPDEGPRVPFSTGTAVSYNYVDYRFRNDTDQDVQLALWCEDGKSYGELRSEREFPRTYELVEEGHHFHQEDDGKYYRISKIYRVTKDRATDEVLDKELILDNHSEVMFDYSLIPADQIR